MALNKAQQYIDDVLSGRQIVGPWILKVVQRHVKDLENGHERGLYFDDAAGKYPAEFIETFCTPPNQDAPMVLMGWEHALIHILYGWKRVDGTRRFRRAYVEIAKKNGKTALVAALCLYHLIADGEQSARCFIAATTLKQAKICFKEACAMRARSAELKSAIQQAGNEPVIALYISDTGSRLSAMARDGDSEDGAVVSFACLDELHRWKLGSSLYSVLRYGGRTRKQPLMFEITTAGSSAGGTSLCYAEREYGTKILDGHIFDDEFFPMIFCMADTPYTDKLSGLPAIKRIKQLCTCAAKYAQTTQPDRRGVKGCAPVATKNSDLKVTHKVNGKLGIDSKFGNATTETNATLGQQNGQHGNPKGLIENTSSQNTNSLLSNTKNCTQSSTGGAPAVVGSESYSLTTSTEPLSSGGCSVTNAIQVLDYSEMLPQEYNKHSTTCNVRKASLLNGVLSIQCPADDWKLAANWCKSNPSMGPVSEGYLFPLETITKEFSEAQGKPTAIGEFKRFCLNVWSSESENPAIELGKWDACAREPLENHPDPKRLIAESLVELNGRRCFAAADLAPKLDTSSLVLVFPPEKATDKWRVIPYFWCPKDNIAARVKRDRVPYDRWADDGFITPTDGNLTDVRFIADQIVEINKQFDLVELAYDSAWSSELIRMLGEAEFPMQKFVSFPQTHVKMNGPCNEWMRKILRKEFAHDANPVMRWQVSNLRWNTQKGTGFIKPDRDKKREKIDGPAAMIMALARATDPENAQKKKSTFWVATSQ